MKALVEEFCRFVERLPLDFNQEPGEFVYESAVLILVDAVLSINRRYDSFVIPRVGLMRKEGIKTLEELKTKIKNDGEEKFCEVWDYNHPDRVWILKRLVEKFLKIKEELGVSDDLEALHKWGKQSKIEDFKHFDVKGIGFTTFQYLRMMCGADTTKPDVHLKRAVRDGIGVTLSEPEIVRIVEAIAKRLKIPTRQLDYALWTYYSRGVKFN